MAEGITEIKLDASPPNGPVGTSYRMKRTPSLTKVSAWNGLVEGQETNDAKGNRTPLLHEDAEDADKHIKIKHLLQDYSLLEIAVICFHRYEKKVANVLMKLLFHLCLISVFESIFFFFYVSSLEDNGIEKTINTFVNGAVQLCRNMTAFDIQVINDFVDPYVNVTQIVTEGARSELARTHFNDRIMDQSWEYAGGLSGMLLCLVFYVLVRKIHIKWGPILIENTLMVSLLGAYEVLFFNKIIYHYQPLTTQEISRNAVQKLSSMCGLFESFESAGVT
jgi:hypothetical protein